jgi:acyl-CoA thioesterase II
VSESLDFLVRLLDLEVIDVNLFRGMQPGEERQRVFGGQVAGQALMAAGRTVARGQVHSLHAYFLRPGDPTIPILYQVDPIRDGRSFTTRRVVAIQHGEAIFTMAASFHEDERGPEHQISMPDVPAPEDLPSLQELLEPLRDKVENLDRWFFLPHPIEQRSVDQSLPWERRQVVGEPRQQIWIRTDGALPDDPLLHACIAAYASDMSLFDTILLSHVVDWSPGAFMGASLDHCMWFHRRVRIDDWLLYDTDSPIAHGARGLARGFLFDRSGELVVSVVQEGLTRVTGTTEP